MPEPDCEPIVSVRDASRMFRMGEVEVAALRDANLDVFRGELLVIAGPSGSGKSTLLNLIGGMDRPTRGAVMVDGRDLAHASDAELTRYRRERIGFVFQFYNLVPMLTAVENVEAATAIAAHPMAPDEALDLVGLSGRRDHFPAQLSGGEQQRVAIARAIASNPDLLLCDEPTGALDIATSRQVLALLVDLKQRLGKSVVLITHNGAIARIADRVATIRDGAIRSIETQPAPEPVETLDW